MLKTPSGTAKPRHVWCAPAWMIATILLFAFVVRAHDLGGSGLQNDEQLWHARSARFVASLLGPLKPNVIELPTMYFGIKYTNLLNEKAILTKHFPFNILMEAPHPGTPVGALIGTSYLLLGKGTSSWSLELAPALEVARYPNVLFGVALVAMIFVAGRRLVGDRAALLAAVIAAVEPMLVGFSRLARLDLSACFWILCTASALIQVYQTNKRVWAIATGGFAALALATHLISAMALVPLVAARFYFDPEVSHPEKPLWRRLLPSRLEWVILATALAGYILLFPNLWTNPVLGLIRQLSVSSAIPPQGDTGTSHIPLSHFFFITRFPEHLLPSTVGLGLAGVGVAFWTRCRTAMFLASWFLLFLLMISVAPGYKETKNGLSLLPPLLLLAGYAVDRFLALAGSMFPVGSRVLVLLLPSLLLVVGLHALRDWWPYPRLYTWSWRPDPNLQKINEFGSEGEGVKEALAYIASQGPDNARIAMVSGINNAEYYYRKDLLGWPASEEDLKDYDWMIVLPKYSFIVDANSSLLRWIRSTAPDHVMRMHQVEMVRLFRLGDHFKTP